MRGGEAEGKREEGREAEKAKKKKRQKEDNGLGMDCWFPVQNIELLGAYYHKHASAYI